MSSFHSPGTSTSSHFSSPRRNHARWLAANSCVEAVGLASHVHPPARPASANVGDRSTTCTPAPSPPSDSTAFFAASHD
eukprot:9434074-Pyramimonas_sp.AAC.1